MARDYSRRRVLTGLAACGSIGTGALILGTGNTSAAGSIEFGELQIPDPSETIDDGSVESVTVSIDCKYSIDSNHTPESAQIRLRAGSSDTSSSTITTTEIGDLSSQMQETETVSGNLLESGFLSQDDFEPSSEGSSKTTRVWIKIGLEVNGDPIASAESYIDVETTWQSMDISGQIGGAGTITVS